MNKPNIFFRLTKIDPIEGIFEAVATAEVEDKSGETCHYETTKPYYQKWSAEIQKASGGKSLGNIRAMHSNIAAGKVTMLDCDDATKTIRIQGKIIDKAEKEKLAEGVYTGVSQGGEYVEKWTENGINYYTANPSEISIVDNPCLAEATFSVVKADGTTEMHKFAPKETPVVVPPELEQVWKAKDGSTWATKAEAKKQNQLLDARAAVAKTTDGVQTLLNGIEDLLDKREFSDDERQKAADAGEAMPDGSFPIKSEQDLKNAVRAVGRASDPAKAKAHIISRAKAMGLTHLLPEDWEGSTKSDKAKAATMKKDLSTVARAACLLEELNWLHSCAEMEEAWEEDETSEAPDQLAEIVKQLCAFLVTYVEEETAEIIEDKGGTGIECPMGAEMMECAVKAPRNHSEALAKLNAGFASILAKVKADEEAAEPADHMDHVTAIHKAASHIMQKCMKCMSPEAEKILKAMADGEELEGHIKAIHKKASHIADHAVAMGATPADDEDDDSSDDEGTEKFMKMAAENSALTKALTGMSEQLAEIQKRLVVVENQPMPRKGRLMIVTKGHEREEEPEESVAESKPYNISGLSPEEARRILI